MDVKRVSGPDPDEITSWITTTYPDTVVAQAMGATFFSLDEQSWPNFATIVTTDEHDMGNPSDLARRGVFRLNIGVGKATFERLTAETPDPDYAALDRVIPHPVYAKQRWIAILNPGRESFDEVVKPLIAEAYQRLAQGPPPDKRLNFARNEQARADKIHREAREPVRRRLRCAGLLR